MTEENTPDVGGVDPGRVRNIIRELNTRADEAKEISGEVSDDQKEFCESTGVNKKALGWLRQLARLKPENRTDVIRSLERGLEIMGPVWGQEPDMFDKAPEPAGDGTVVPIGGEGDPESEPVDFNQMGDDGPDQAA
jgi:hypothetical protein